MRLKFATYAQEIKKAPGGLKKTSNHKAKSEDVQLATKKQHTDNLAVSSSSSPSRVRLL